MVSGIFMKVCVMLPLNTDIPGMVVLTTMILRFLLLVNKIHGYPL